MSRTAKEVKANGGYDFCQDCLYCDSDICDVCEDGDQFDEGGENAQVAPDKKKVVSIRKLKELAFA